MMIGLQQWRNPKCPSVLVCAPSNCVAARLTNAMGFATVTTLFHKKIRASGAVQGKS